MLRLGIIGAGIMGSNHARVALGIRNARVSAVVDPDEARAATLANAVGSKWFATLDEAIHEIDAAVLATPTEFHASQAITLIEAGISVLIEKPLASDVIEGKRVVEAAGKAKVHAQVGHVERFNPSILELDNLLDDPLHVDAARISPFTSRVKDGVIFDLLVHDLDIVGAIANSDLASVQALSKKHLSGTEDMVSALLQFENGISANLTASRIGQNKIRRLEITQANSFISIDLLRQDIAISRVEHSEYLSEHGTRYRQSGMVEIPFLEHRGEPLFLQLEDFVECIRTGCSPRVSVDDAFQVLEWGWQIKRALAEES